jgi:uncharacterized RDD family membrane protein YckC
MRLSIASAQKFTDCYPDKRSMNAEVPALVSTAPPTVRLAKVMTRVLTASVDVAVMLAVFSAGVVLAGARLHWLISFYSSWLLGPSQWGAFFAGMCLLYWWRDEAKRGATFGKRLFRMRVVDEDYEPCSSRAAFQRNLCKAVTILVPISLVVTLAVILLSSRRQRIGDKWARTCVVDVDKPDNLFWPKRNS